MSLPPEYAVVLREELCKGAAENMPPYERVHNATLLAEELHNYAGLSRLERERGVLYCVGSLVVQNGSAPADKLGIEPSGMLRRQRVYPQMDVTAHYVGLWPRRDKARPLEAALFTINTSFVPLPEHAETPFKAAVADVLECNSHPYTGYDRISEAGSGVVFGSAQVVRRSPPLFSVTATPDTTVSTRQTGINTIDNEIQVRTRFTGPARLTLPGKTFIQVQRDKILRSPPEDATLPIHIGAGHRPIVASEVRLPKGGRSTMGAAGEIIVQGEPEPEDDSKKFKHNPTLTTAEAWRLVRKGIDWHDITDDFIQNVRLKLLEACPISPEASYQSILEQAQQAVDDYLEQHAAHSQALGCLAVTDRIGQMSQDFARSGNDKHIGRRFFATHKG